ncbi:MAG: secondary thiamine-phosphate synthase enzyme YjbQ [Oscillospiraceae bacterium]|jgi:secondary thiamine-phosphate synthase enzyme
MLYNIDIETELNGCPSITAQVNDLVKKSGVKEGLCIVSVPDGTAGLCITSFWDVRGLYDLEDEISRNIPNRVSYRNQESPHDASGRVKSALMGTSKALIIHEGKLILGSSQGLVYMEFDGPRKRSFQVEIVEKA